MCVPRQQHLVVESRPAAPLEVVEPEFLLHLLVGLLRTPARIIAAAVTLGCEGTACRGGRPRGPFRGAVTVMAAA